MSLPTMYPGKPFRPEKMSDSSARRVARLERANNGLERRA